MNWAFRPWMDDRGQRYVPYVAFELRTVSERADFPRAEFEYIRSRIRAEDPAFSLKLRIIVVLQTIFATVLIGVSLLWWKGWTDAFRLMFFLFAAASGWWTYRAMLPTRRMELIRRAMLRYRRCPACAYRLSGLPLESDGCTVCPECGAAWRFPTSSQSLPRSSIVLGSPSSTDPQRETGLP